MAENENNKSDIVKIRRSIRKKLANQAREMAREIGWNETKSIFLPLKVPKMTKIVSPKTGNELAEVVGRLTSQIGRNVCLFGLCQVFER